MMSRKLRGDRPLLQRKSLLAVNPTSRKNPGPNAEKRKYLTELVSSEQPTGFENPISTLGTLLSGLPQILSSL